MDKETQDAFKAMGNLINDGFTAIGQSMATKQDLEPIKADIQDMKTDITEMKTDITAMKANITKIKSDTHYIQNDTKTIPDLFNLIKEHEELHIPPQP